MTRLKNVLFLVVATVLLAYLALFPVLTLDTLNALIKRVASFEAGNFTLIFYLEAARAFTTLAALIAAGFLVMRTHHTQDGRALALFLIFTALTYEKLFAANVYPGPFQEKLTVTLIDAGVSRAVLIWLFGALPWPFWLALAAALRFSVVFPKALTPAAIDLSGQHDRRGMLRGAAAAGVDVGAAFRALAKRLLRARSFTTTTVWMTALLLVAITTVISGGWRAILFAIIGTLGIGIVITNLRAASVVGNEPEKARVRWLVLGFLLSGALFLVAALPALFFNNPLATVPALILLMLAPAALMICLALSVLYSGRFDTQRALRRLPEYAAVGLVLLIAFGIMTTLFVHVTEWIGMGRTLAVLVASLITGLLAQPLSKVTRRAVNRVLERPSTDVLS